MTLVVADQARLSRQRGRILNAHGDLAAGLLWGPFIDCVLPDSCGRAPLASIVGPSSDRMHQHQTHASDRGDVRLVSLGHFDHK